MNTFSLSHKISTYYSLAIDKVEGFSAYKAALVIILLNALFFIPQVTLNQQYLDLVEYREFKIANPFSFHSTNPETKELAIVNAYRVTVPLIANALHLPFKFVIIAQYTLGYLFLVLLFKYFKNLHNDSKTAFLLTLSLSFTYLWRSFFYDIFGYYDSFSVFLLLAAIVLNRWAVLPFIMLTLFFSNEANLISCFWLSMYFSFNQDFELKNFSLKNYLTSKYPFIYIGSACCYLAIRVILSDKYDIPFINLGDSRDVGFYSFLYAWDILKIGIIGAFDVYWGFVLILPVLLIYRKLSFNSLAWLGLIFLSLIFPAIIKNFQTSSSLYLFPLVLIAYRVFSQGIKFEFQQKFAIFLLIACVFIPSTFFDMGVCHTMPDLIVRLTKGILLGLRFL